MPGLIAPGDTKAFQILENEFSDVFVFGDSLSDTGNLASVIGDFPDPPYYMGSRVSNGAVAVEVLQNA